jgi:hypothetical protein
MQVSKLIHHYLLNNRRRLANSKNLRKKLFCILSLNSAK